MNCAIKALFCAFILTFFNQSNAQINLIWQMDRIHTWEEDWIMEMLSGLDIQVVDDGHYEMKRDLSIIVSNYNPQLSDYIKDLRSRGLRFGIILTSDEAYSIPTDFYQYADFIFRNYWHPAFEQNPRIVQFPLGYKNKLWADGKLETKKSHERKYIWSFAGRLDHHYRTAMINSMRRISNHHIHQIHAWADARSLSTQDYRDLMLDSIFIPCARGYYNLDSFRLYEALECGCIPIVEQAPDDYFGKFYGSHPFIAVNGWHEAPMRIQKLLNNPAALEEKRVECQKWWTEYKHNLNKKFVAIIQKTFNL